MTKVTVARNKNYTNMSNYHLRDKRLTWKAKGIMSFMLSLPESWDYSIRGLATCTQDGRVATTSALNELKKYGYLVTKVQRTDDSRAISDLEYILYESPEMNPDYVARVTQKGTDEKTTQSDESKPKPSPKKMQVVPKPKQEQKRTSGFLDSGFLHTENPSAGNLHAGFLHTENPTMDSASKNLQPTGNVDAGFVDPQNVDPQNLPQINTNEINTNEKRDNYIYSGTPDTKPGSGKTRPTEKTPTQTPATLDPNPRHERGPVNPDQPPTAEEVASYCVRLEEAGMPMTIDADEFVDYYYSKGWDKIRDWKAAIRNWQRNSNKQQDGQTQSGAPWSQDPSMSAPRNQGTDSRLETLRKLWNQYDQEEQEAAKKES